MRPCAKSRRHGCDEVRNLNSNLNTPDYIKKVNAFFEYAKHDPNMVSGARQLALGNTTLTCEQCQSLNECGKRLEKLDKASGLYNEGDYMYEFLTCFISKRPTSVSGPPHQT